MSLLKTLAPESFHSGSIFPVPSHNFTSDLALVPTLIPALAFALAPVSESSDELFRRFIRAYLESNQEPSRSPAKYKQFFKAKMPDMYYEKPYMDCYHFCQ